MRDLTMLAIYATSIVGGVGIGVATKDILNGVNGGFAVLGIIITLWIIKDEIAGRIEAHYERKLAPKKKEADSAI